MAGSGLNSGDKTGQADLEVGAGGCVGDGDGPVVGLDDVADDGQPEAAPSGVGGAGVVEAGEAFEEAFPIVGRYAGTVVGDGQDGCVAGFGELEGDGAGGLAWLEGSMLGKTSPDRTPRRRRANEPATVTTTGPCNRGTHVRS